MGMFDRIAPVYDDLSGIFLSDLEKHIFERTDLNKGDKVLDVAGGTGRLMGNLSKMKPKTSEYVVDRSRNMLKRASSDTYLALGDASDLPFESNTFDLVVCIDAFHHFDRKRESLGEMIRVLGSDGEVIILELEANHPLTKIVEGMEFLVREPSSFYEKEKLVDVFLDSGLDVNIEKINFFQYILHASR